MAGPIKLLLSSGFLMVVVALIGAHIQAIALTVAAILIGAVGLALSVALAARVKRRFHRTPDAQPLATAAAH